MSSEPRWIAAMRGRALPIIRGADPITDVFPDLDDLAAVQTVAELDELQNDVLEIFNVVAVIARGQEPTPEQLDALDPDIRSAIEGHGAEGDPDHRPGLSPDEAVAALERGADQIDSIRSRSSEIAETDRQRQERIDELAGRANPDAQNDPDDDDPGDDPAGDEPPADDDAAPPAADADRDAVTAAGNGRTRRRLGRSDRAAPRDTQPGGDVIALAEVPGMVAAGAPLRSMREIGEAFAARIKNVSHVYGATDGQRFPVVSFRRPAPKQRVAGDNPERNMIAFRQAIADQGGIFGPLLAHGGIHAPQATPEYRFPDSQISTAQPVRDLLPSVAADRGGITFYRPPLLSEVPGAAVGDVTATEDASVTSSDYTKTVGRIAFSGSPVTVLVDAVYHQLEWGVFDQRTWPEMIDYYTQLTLAAYARFAELRRLDAIQAASTAVTPTGRPDNANTQPITPTLGTYAATKLAWSAWIIGELDLLATGYRQSHRLPANLKLRVLAPRWVEDLYFREQIWRGRLDVNPNEFSDALARRNLVLSTFDDSPTTPAMNFAIQNAAAVKPFPTTVEFTVFADGTFVYLDGGQLDLGVIRDSALVSTNDYRVFFESFENIAKVGNDSYKMQFTTTVNGVYNNGAIALPG